MSGTTLAQTKAAPRRWRELITRGWRAGLAVGFFSFVIFAVAANRLVDHGYIVPTLRTLWDQEGLQTQIGGQWTTQLLISLCRLIPGSSVQTLTVLTISGAVLVQSIIAHDLVKRGWPALPAALSVGLTGLHPVMLYLATNGSPMLLYASLAGLTVIALDRLEAIGDTQSLMVMGLSVALLLLTWPNAIFFVLPLALLLPLAFRSGRSVTGITAMYIIIAAPSLIVVAAAIIGGTLFEISWSELAASWASPLHGGSLSIVSMSVWLNHYGGHPVRSFLSLLFLCSALVPRSLVILVRFATRPAERKRPATALAALLLPPAAGALATWFWQTNSPWIVVALSMLCSSSWAATVRFRPWERWLWTFTIFCGVLVSWLSPLLWTEPDLIAWRQIILSPFTSPLQ